MKLNGGIHLTEQTGTVANPNAGSLILDHENNGGASSITFRSKANRGSDFGYIQYQDADNINGGGESARLIIGVQNDGDDHICLMPSGNVGIGLMYPRQKLEVQGHALINGEIIAFNIKSMTNIYATENMESGNDIYANRHITANANLTANANIVAQNNVSARNNMFCDVDLTVRRNIFAVSNIYISGFTCPFTTFQFTNVTEHNGSRQINIPLRATNAYIYLYFGDIGSHALFIKQGNSYSRRVGSGGNSWDFCETNGDNVRCWYHWRSVGDRITAICSWFN